MSDKDSLRRKIKTLADKYREADSDEEAEEVYEELQEKKAELDRQEKADEIIDELDQPADNAASRSGGQDAEAKTSDDVLNTEDHADLLENYYVKGRDGLDAEQKSIFNTLRDDEGGYVVPEEQRQELIRNMENANHIRDRAETISISSKGVRFPVMDVEDEPQWDTENSSSSEADASNSFGQQRFTPHKLSHIVKVTEELLQDNAVNVSDLLLDRFSELFAKKEERAFINGDGNGKPKGLLSGDISSNSANASPFDEDDIMDLIYSVKQQYRDSGVFLMDRAAVNHVRTLKDNDGQYLWQPGLQEGEPDRLAGYPLLETEYMNDPETASAGDPIMVFGDFSSYRVVDRINLTTQRLDEKYIDNGVIGFRMTKRVDAKPTLDEPIQILDAS